MIRVILMKLLAILSCYLVSIFSVNAAEKAVPIFNGRDLSGWVVKSQDAEKEKAVSYWSVVDGAIQLETKGDKEHGNVWLCYDEELVDFELTLKLRSIRFTKGNSGIQIRSRYVPQLDGKKGSLLSGPQIDVHPRGPFRTGLIYDATVGINRWIYPSKKDWGISWTDVDHIWMWRDLDKEGHYIMDSNAKAMIATPGLSEEEQKQGWNTMKIRAKGFKIQTWVNGLPVADYDGVEDLTTDVHKRLNVGSKGKIFIQLHAKNDLGMQFKDVKLLKFPVKRKVSE